MSLMSLTPNASINDNDTDVDTVSPILIVVIDDINDLCYEETMELFELGDRMGKLAIHFVTRADRMLNAIVMTDRTADFAKIWNFGYQVSFFEACKRPIVLSSPDADRQFLEVNVHGVASWRYHESKISEIAIQRATQNRHPVRVIDITDDSFEETEFVVRMQEDQINTM